MTNLQQKEVIDLIELEKESLGSYAAVANKCQVSEATISQIRKGTYATDGNEMIVKIAIALGWQAKDWVWVETTNTDIVANVLNDAKKRSMFLAISEKAGHGKTAGIKLYLQKNPANVFYIRAEEWSKRIFLTRLCKALGIYNNGLSVDDILDQISSFFQQRATLKPLLIIDQWDKLKPAAKRVIIPFFNDNEDSLAIVACGTDHLRKELETGVRYSTLGYDEIHSRFGRRFISLLGSKLLDVRNICKANGIANETKQKEIFEECNPVKKMVENKLVQFVEDHRRLKRIIQRELLIAQDKLIHQN